MSTARQRERERRRPKKLRRSQLPPAPAVAWSNSPADLRWAENATKKRPFVHRQKRERKLVKVRKPKGDSNRMVTKVTNVTGEGTINPGDGVLLPYLVPAWEQTQLVIPAGFSGQVQGNKKFPNEFAFDKKFFRGWWGSVSSQAWLPQSRGGGFGIETSHTGPWAPNLDWGGVSLSHTFDRSSSRAINKIYEQMDSGLNLAVDIAEGKSAAKMLIQCIRLRKLALSFVDGLVFPDRLTGRGKTRTQERAEFLASRWLEKRYGINPFVSSVIGVVEELNREFSGAPIVLKGRASDPSQRTSLSGSGTYEDPFVSMVETSSARTEYECAFKPNAMDPSLERWTSLSKAGIAWELAPFSFVFDWAIDVGGYLAELEAVQKYQKNLLWLRRTDTYKKTSSRRWYGSTKDPTYYWANGTPIDGTGRLRERNLFAMCRETGLKRTIGITLPTARPPVVELNLTTKRLVDALGLLTVCSKAFSRKVYG